MLQDAKTSELPALSTKGERELIRTEAARATCAAAASIRMVEGEKDTK
jgi:hypothetical protein